MNLNTLQFLKAILPDDGIKVARVIRKNRLDKNDKTGKYNKFADTIDGLAHLILDEDARQHDPEQYELSVYHACAVFKSRGKPVKDNALGAKCFWLDVDAGEGKPYADASAAAHAVAAFCARTGLPAPIYVGSGVGLHIYWPLERMLDRETWERYAEGLKALCYQHGLDAGRERTADIASILRTPGTFHRKKGAAPVMCGPMAGPYALEMFNVFLGAEAPAKVAPKAKAPKQKLPSVIAAATTQVEFGPKFAEPIAAQCAQVRMVRDNPGGMNEPLWYAVLGVLGFAEDGADYALRHTDPAWHGTINDKLEQWRSRATGATTCAKFSDLNPAGCEGCPLAGKITSPISLGRKQPASAIPNLPPPAPVLEAMNQQTLPNVPAPWRWSATKQLVMDVADSQGEDAEAIVVSEYPIFLDSVQIGEVQHEKVSYLFKQFLPQEGWIDIHLSAKTAFSSAGMSEFFGKGAVIHDSKAFLAYIRYAVVQYLQSEKRRLRYDQFGWKNGETEFLYGSQLYSAERKLTALGSDEVTLRSKWLQPAPGGSLERWSNAANQLFAVGCEPQSFALLAAFAAPLMRFHSTDEGGAIVSLVSRKSGTGKSTALSAAASVFGATKGLALTNIDTKVSKGLTLGVLGNLPAVYDELSNRDPEVLKEFVLIFTNGRDKMRGNAEGGIQHTQASWQTILIAGSNLSVIDAIQAASKIDALGYRIIELPAALPDAMPHSTGDRLKKELEANYGYAGDAYLRTLLQPQMLDWAKKAMAQWTDEIWKATGFKSEHRFWVRTLGSVAVAGTIVSKMGILNFSTSRIVEWAIAHLKDAAGTTSGQIQAPAEVSYSSILSEFLNENIGDTLVMQGVMGKNNGRQVPLIKPLRRLAIRYEVGTARIMISESILRDYLIRNEVSPRAMFNSLREQGVILNTRRMVTLGAGTDIPGGQIPCVEVNASHPAIGGGLQPIEKIMTSQEASA